MEQIQRFVRDEEGLPAIQKVRHGKWRGELETAGGCGSSLHCYLVKTPDGLMILAALLNGNALCRQHYHMVASGPVAPKTAREWLGENWNNVEDRLATWPSSGSIGCATLVPPRGFKRKVSSEDLERLLVAAEAQVAALKEAMIR